MVDYINTINTTWIIRSKFASSIFSDYFLLSYLPAVPEHYRTLPPSL